MSRTITVAAIQRLVRAEWLIGLGKRRGARLIVLPEVFNTGYRYTDDNFRLAEPIDGLTVTWMKEVAAQKIIERSKRRKRNELGRIVQR